MAMCGLALSASRGPALTSLGLGALGLIGFSAASVASLIEGRTLGALGTAIASILSAALLARVVSALRQPPPLLNIDGDRGVGITHPLWLEPISLPTSDVHSIWHGPFPSAAELDRSRTSWRLRSRSVMDFGEARGDSNSAAVVLVVLATARTIAPRLRVPRWFLELLNQAKGLDSGHEVRAVRLLAAEGTLGAITTCTQIRPGADMPPDVVAWIRG